MRNRLFMIAVDPPGNAAREISLYRRRLFEALGEPSARAFPDSLPLAFAPPRHRRATAASDSDRAANASETTAAGAKRVRSSAAALSRIWAGIEGSFDAAAPFEHDGLLYLGVSGPIAKVRDSAYSAFQALGFDAFGLSEEKPLRAGIGFFLCKASRMQEALDAALRLAPSDLHFDVCSIALYRLDMGDAPFEAMVWHEQARALRPGAHTRPPRAGQR